MVSQESISCPQSHPRHNSRDIPTLIYAGCEAAALVSGLSESQFWTATTTEPLYDVRRASPVRAALSSYHPIYLFLVNMAAIGMVLLNVLLMSPAPSFAAGCW